MLCCYWQLLFFKSDEEEWKELTEPAKCLDSAIFYTEKSKEMRQELFFMHWNWISALYRPIWKFGYWNPYWEGRKGTGTSLN